MILQETDLRGKSRFREVTHTLTHSYTHHHHHHHQPPSSPPHLEFHHAQAPAPVRARSQHGLHGLEANHIHGHKAQQLRPERQRDVSQRVEQGPSSVQRAAEIMGTPARTGTATNLPSCGLRHGRYPEACMHAGVGAQQSRRAGMPGKEHAGMEHRSATLTCILTPGAEWQGSNHNRRVARLAGSRSPRPLLADAALLQR